MAVCDLLLLTMGIGTLIVIPAWNPPSLEIEIVYPLWYPIGNISYMGSLYLTILLSFERYMAVCHRINITKRKTLKYIVYVFLFVLIFCLPTFGIWKWEYDNGILKAKPTNLLYNKTFNMVYFAVLNGCFRSVLPTLSLIVFNILIYKEVICTYS